MITSDLFPECAKCKTLADCPAPDVAHDLRGTPLPPEGCPRQAEIMKNTLKKKKDARSSSRDA